MFGDWMRRAGFWTLDAMRGGKIRKNYKDVKKKMETGVLDTERLNILLKHAAEQAPFYKNCAPDDFYSFPVIDKNTIKGQWKSLHAKNYIGKPLHHMATSGSTGTPFIMEWDMEKRKRQMAELIYFNKLVGQELGQPYVYFRVWTDQNKKSRKELLMQNLWPVDIFHLNKRHLERIRQRLKHRPYINTCLGYASTYEHLVRYVRAKGDTPDMYPIKTMITGSEVMSLETKQMIKDTFGCRIIDRYSNEENGFLAQSGDMSDEFLVNTSGFRIEILRQDSDEPAKLQKEVGRVVVTDLYSFAVPLIRYDTGDLAIAWEEKDGWVTTMKTIQGRQVDLIYDTKGNALTPHTWSVHMWKFDKLAQYQFIQEGEKEYILKVNGAKGVYEDEEFVDHLRTVLGKDAEIRIEHVTGIPCLNSGKFKKTICNYTRVKDDL